MLRSALHLNRDALVGAGEVDTCLLERVILDGNISNQVIVTVLSSDHVLTSLMHVECVRKHCNALLL